MSKTLNGVKRDHSAHLPVQHRDGGFLSGVHSVTTKCTVAGASPDDECAEWLCERCCDFDPKDLVSSSRTRRDTRAGRVRTAASPSQEPETHMQTWPEFCEWGIVVEDEKNPLLRK